MDKTEKTINQILSINAPKNQVEENITFSLASKMFKDAHSNITTDALNLMKLNPSFIVSACNVVENLYNDGFKTDKKQLAIKILKECLSQKNLDYFGDEIKHLEIIIEDLHSNGKVKKISLKKKLGNNISNFFLSLLN